MNLSDKLSCLRKYWNKTVEGVSEELGLGIQTYIQLEDGRANMDGVIAQRLSDLYYVPVEFFVIDDSSPHVQAEIVYNNCLFTRGSSGYINPSV